LEFYRGLCRLVLGFAKGITGSGKGNPEILARDSFVVIGESCSFQFRQGLPEPPDEEEFLKIVSEKGSAAAVDVFRRFRSADPALKIFSEKAIIDLVYQYGPEKAAELIPLLEINLECYPGSAESCLWLAQSWLALDKREKALEYARKALELDPENEKARKLIGMISSAE
jgi:tetratricopeptide (TPR) repeat protein